MPFLLLFLFLAYPLLEIALLIRVGGIIGVLPTLLVIVGTAVLGAAALRRQGLVIMRRAAEAMRAGRPPVEPVMEGALFGLAGFFLIVPGLVSDALGLALLVPPVRHLVARWISRSLVTVAEVHVERGASGEGASGKSGEDQTPIVIEGEFTRIDEKPVSGSDRGSDRSKDRK